MKSYGFKNKKILIWSKISLCIVASLITVQQANAVVKNSVKADTKISGDSRVHPYSLQEGESVALVIKNNKLTLEQVWDINSFAFKSKQDLLAAPVGSTLYLPVAGTVKPVNAHSTASKITVNHQNKKDEYFEGKPVAKDLSGADYAAGLASQAAGNQVEGLLNQFGGSSRISLGTGLGSSSSEIAGDVLIPLFDNLQKNLLFTQLGFRRIDGRQTLNLGLGSRYFTDTWMIGGNAFFDNDITGKNRRWGLGAEWWTDNLRLSANGYMRITDWHASRNGVDMEERPANGWDVEAQAWLPAYPQLGGKLKYEQYYGQNVALISYNELRSDPSALSASINWTPVPLLTLEGEHRALMGGKADNLVRLMFNYDFGRSLAASLDPSQVATMRSLQGGRYDLVSRNNRIVLDYRKQTLISMSMNTDIQGIPGSKMPLDIKVASTNTFKEMRLVATEFEAAGGKFENKSTKEAALILPDYKQGESNIYTLTAIAVDDRGKDSAPIKAKITVNNAASVEKSKTTISNPTISADGSTETALTVVLKDLNDKAIEGAEGKLTLKVEKSAEAFAVSNDDKPVTFTAFVASSVPGSYTSTIKAGNTPGKVTLTPSFNSQLLASTTLTLTPAVTVGNRVSSLESTNETPVVGDTVTLHATVHNAQGEGVKDVDVTFTRSDTQAKQTVKTKAKGIASLDYTITKPGPITFNAKVGESQGVDKTLNFSEVKQDIKSIELTIPNKSAKVDSPLNFSLKVMGNDNLPVKHQTVSFNSFNKPLTLTGELVTDEKGEVQGSISSAAVGDFPIQMFIGEVVSSKETLTFTDEQGVKKIDYEVIGGKNEAPVDGKFEVKFTVKDQHGEIIKRIPVVIKLGSGKDVTIESADETDDNGIVTAKFTKPRGTKSGKFTATIEVGGISQSTNELHFEAIIGKLPLKVSPRPSMKKFDQFLFTITVIDSDGNFVAGKEVNFNKNKYLKFGSMSALTDSMGKASVIATAMEVVNSTVVEASINNYIVGQANIQITE